jgi:hypothetical protein
MIQRCYNPTCREFRSYGQRGIAVCERWLEANGFAHFLADIGRRPSAQASLHRPDNDGAYGPGNAVWAGRRAQARNRRSNRVLSLGGRTQILAAWAEELGMKPVTLAQRLHKGWPPERALTQPVAPRKPYAEWARRNPNPRKPGPKPRAGEAGKANKPARTPICE